MSAMAAYRSEHKSVHVEASSVGLVGVRSKRRHYQIDVYQYGHPDNPTMNPRSNGPLVHFHSSPYGQGRVDFVVRLDPSGR